MSLKTIVREMKDGISSTSKRGRESKQSHSWRKSHIAPDLPQKLSQPIELGQWASLPHELLLDIIQRVEDSETSWPARAAIVSCASVCKSWREVVKEVVKTPEQCGRLTFPISLKQPGPRDSPVQCFIRRNRETSTYLLYFGLVPSENGSDKLLLAAKKIRRATGTEFVISLVADDFSRASNTYVGKVRSNFLGTKFTIYDSQPPHDAAVKPYSRSSRRFHSKQVSPRVPACNFSVGSIAYELNVLRTRGPRRMHCTMNSCTHCFNSGRGHCPNTNSISTHLR
ncbi:Tubby-like F-box protein [Quillaja saponaria]|uniref:Tubby-like F-box protein n=1 Tax=Quillaja saponaria TaxID=32244 RepID=A0AAD7KR89_QUISA|nr:Tubby-like F-box protein [Quillaja saponaria]